MTLAPRSFAFTTLANAMGCASAILLPMIRMASLLTRSCGKVVAPPRPSEVPRPGTVELCHTNLRSEWYNRGNDEGREEDLFWERESHEPPLIFQWKKSKVA